jgi:alcohol dehydrogenase class IV
MLFPPEGGSFNMPHAETHTVILPHAIAYNAPYAKEAIGKVAAAMGVDDAAKGIYDLCASLGGPQSLEELGFKRENLEKAADLASQAQYPNPAPLERSKLLDLLTAAFEGKPPGWRA